LREREEIAETPIEQAMKNYRETRGALLVVYVLLIGVLIAAGVHTFYDENPVSSASSSGTSPSLSAVPIVPAKPP
jgi:uncharacterized membrane protein YraQ (UPF0718 family)